MSTSGEFIQMLVNMARESDGPESWNKLRTVIKEGISDLSRMAQSPAGKNSTMLLEYTSKISGITSCSSCTLLFLTVQASCLKGLEKRTWLNQALIFLGLTSNTEKDNIQYISPLFKTFHTDMSAITDMVGKLALEFKDCTVAAIEPLTNTATFLRLDSQTTYLTSADVALAQVCVGARMYRYAADYMTTTNIFEINPPVSAITVEQYLTFYYYGALAYIGVQNYSMALEFLNNCITVPGTAPSAISLLAYRTAMLVSLLHTGKALTMPNHISTVVQQTVLNSAINSDVDRNGEIGLGLGSGEYHDILSMMSTGMSNRGRDRDREDRTPNGMPFYVLVQDAFLNSSPAALLTQIQAPEVVAFLSDDGNLGLANSLCDAQMRFRMKNLTSTYITLSLEDIARQLNMPDVLTAEKEVISLIASGDIRARLDQSTGMVSFTDNESESESTESTAEAERKEVVLMNNIRTTLNLQAQLEKLRCNTYSSPAYIQHVTAPSSKGAGGSGGVSGMLGGLGDYDLGEFGYFE